MTGTITVIKAFLRKMSSEREIFVIDIDLDENACLRFENADSSGEREDRIRLLKGLVKANRTRDIFIAVKNLSQANKAHYASLATELEEALVSAYDAKEFRSFATNLLTATLFNEAPLEGTGMMRATLEIVKNHPSNTRKKAEVPRPFNIEYFA